MFWTTKAKQFLLAGMALVATSHAQASPGICAEIFGASPSIHVPQTTNGIELQPVSLHEPRRDRRMWRVPRFFSIDKIPLPQEEVDAVVNALSQTERSILFFHLIDNPNLAFGPLSSVLKNWTGYQSGNSERRYYWTSQFFPKPWRTFSPEPYVLRKKVEGPNAKLDRRAIRGADAFYRLMDAASRTKDGDKTFEVMMPKTDRSNIDSADLDTSDMSPMNFPLEPRALAEYEGQIGHSYAPIDDSEARAIAKLRDYQAFFDWVNEKPDRVAYAKLLLRVAIEPIFVLGNRHDVCGCGPESAVIQNRMSGMITSSTGYSASALFNLRVDIGARLGAFAKNPATSMAIIPIYSSVRDHSPDRRQQDTIKQVNMAVSVLNSDGTYDSMPSLKRLVLSISNDAFTASSNAKAFSNQAGEALNDLVNMRLRSSVDQRVEALEALHKIEIEIARVESEVHHYAGMFDYLARRIDEFEAGLKHVERPSTEIQITLQNLAAYRPTFVQTRDSLLSQLRATVATLRQMHDRASQDALSLMR